MKNLGASIRQRLLNLARKEGVDFDYILRQFVIQRLLYRLSISNYAKRFYLKGALLFWVWDNTFHRPTRDIDLLGFGSGDPPTLKKIFLDIIIIKCNDGLSFDTSSVSSEIIKEEAAYQGVRITGFASLNKAIIPYQVDIGFGDVVTPQKLLNFCLAEVYLLKSKHPQTQIAYTPHCMYSKNNKTWGLRGRSF